jgi:hypothetical protein
MPPHFVVQDVATFDEQKAINYRSVCPTADELSDPFLARVNSCDREPIHIPGSIQPHGLMLVAGCSDL